MARRSSCAFLAQRRAALTKLLKKPESLKRLVIVCALLYSLTSFNNCLVCLFQEAPSVQISTSDTVAPVGVDGELDDIKEEWENSAGFLMPRTIHTVSVEEHDEHVKCKTACRIEVQLTCSESSRKECPDVRRIAARSAVAFEDLATGDYILTTTCTDAEHACHADPQEFPFHVQAEQGESVTELKHIPLVTIRLSRGFTRRCSRQQVWRSRFTCLGILYTLMGVGLLAISHTGRIQYEELPPSVSDDLRWLLQSRARS